MHSLIEKLKSGEKPLGCFVTFDTALGTRSLANAGLDFIFIDQQHGMIDMQAIDHMVTPLLESDCCPIVRVSHNDPGLIMNILDRGALGIVCPMVNSANEAESFMSAMRYPPLGSRSWAPLKPNLYFGESYTEQANREILAIAQIETKTAVENLDEILSTKGLDAILVGPNDLGFSYGDLPKAMPDHPEAIAAIKHIAKKCKEVGIFSGIHCGDTDMAKNMFEWGYDFASIGSDMNFLIQKAKETIIEMR